MPAPHLAPTVAAYPRIARLLAAGAVHQAAEALRALAADPAAGPIAPALCEAARTLAALDRGALPDPDPGAGHPRTPPVLSTDVTVIAGIRPLVGELGWLLLETGRPSAAARHFAALGALAPDRAAAGIGLCAAHLACDDVEAAVEAGRWAVSAEPADGSAHAVLAEALLAAGRKEAARLVLLRAPRGHRASGAWVRLMRHGIEDGWLSLGAEPARVA
jgi:hypothetical protein